MHGGAGAAAAAIAQAIKASGVLVRVEPSEFSNLLRRAEQPLVVVSESGIFGTSYRYLMSYRGLAFYTKSRDPLTLGSAEVVRAGRIWVPG